MVFTGRDPGFTLSVSHSAPFLMFCLRESMCLVACGCKAVFKASERTQHPMVTTLVNKMTPKDRLCWLGCWPKKVLGLFSNLLWLSLTFPRSVDPGAGEWVTAQTPPCSARGCQRLVSSGTTLVSLGIFLLGSCCFTSRVCSIFKR